MGKRSRRKRTSKRTELRPTQEQLREFLWLVRDDLAFLRSQNRHKPSPTDVRLASSVLRRLLYDATYQIAWSVSGLEGQPTFEGVDLETAVSDVPPRYIQYAYAGGASTANASHSGHLFISIPGAEAEKEGVDAAAQRVGRLYKQGVRRAFSLAEFCASASVISGEGAISRLGIVRYVANKLGGVHWDNERGAWTDPVGSRHRLLDENHIVVGRLTAPLYEVLSIAQAVAFAESTDRLLERIAAIAPREDRSADVISFREGRTGMYADMAFVAKQAQGDSAPSRPEAFSQTGEDPPESRLGRVRHWVGKQVIRLGRWFDPTATWT